MRVNGPFAIVPAASPRTCAASARAAQKTSAASGLHAETQGSPPREEKRPRTLRVELVSRNETDGRDPFRDAPRLSSCFAAQLLGQVMPERRDAARIQTAYGSAAPRMALLLDRKS